MGASGARGRSGGQCERRGCVRTRSQRASVCVRDAIYAGRRRARARAPPEAEAHQTYRLNLGSVTRNNSITRYLFTRRHDNVWQIVYLHVRQLRSCVERRTVPGHKDCTYVFGKRQLVIYDNLRTLGTVHQTTYIKLSNIYCTLKLLSIMTLNFQKSYTIPFYYIMSSQFDQYQRYLLFIYY